MEIEGVNVKEMIIQISEKAGEAVMKIYSDHNLKIKYKEGSPVTRADKESHAIIFESLKSAKLDIPIISEESTVPEFSQRKDWKLFWLIDPLDGTKEFISRNGEFTINIALISEGRPIAGVVHIPFTGITYYGDRINGASIKSENTTRSINVRMPEKPLRVMSSRSHMNIETKQFIENFGEYDLVQAGSSLKFCKIAEGKADIYPRLGTTMEWDTAAAQAILESAGGQVKDLSGNDLEYNKPEMKNPYFVAASSYWFTGGRQNE